MSRNYFPLYNNIPAAFRNRLRPVLLSVPTNHKNVPEWETFQTILYLYVLHFISPASFLAINFVNNQQTVWQKTSSPQTSQNAILVLRFIDFD